MAKLYFRYGTMDSGKSIDILKTAHNYRQQGKHVMLFTPAINDRDGVGVISSRIGLKENAIVIHEDTNVYSIVDSLNFKPDCILVDEAQFLSAYHVGQLGSIVDFLDIPVICYGLKSDFQGVLFEGSEALLILADRLEEVKTVCWHCKKKALFNMRTINGKPVFEGDQIQIGGNESYQPVCRKCYYTLQSKWSK